MSYTREQLERWLKTISVSAGTRILDIGGSQKPVAGRIANDIPAEGYKILDLEQPHEGRKPDIVWDINYKLPTDKPFEKFDVVFCLEVMEYVWNPVQALENINRLLKQDGALFISSPLVYPVHNPKEQDYLRYTEFGMRKLLKETGFEIADIESRGMKNADLLNAVWQMEGMKPSKDYDSHDAVGHLISAVKK